MARLRHNLDKGQPVMPRLEAVQQSATAPPRRQKLRMLLFFKTLEVEMHADCDDLGRFVDAQNSIYSRVSAELAAGRKQSHWMWFVFPQIEGLGSSAMAQRYAIRSRAEAEAYLAHPVLGPRLLACTRLML